MKLLVWGGATGAMRDCLQVRLQLSYQPSPAQASRLVAARDLEWRHAPAPGPPALYLRETSSLTTGPREEGPARALASLKAALACPVITDLKPRLAAQLVPGMPAYELLSCLRHRRSNH